MAESKKSQEQQLMLTMVEKLVLMTDKVVEMAGQLTRAMGARTDAGIAPAREGDAFIQDPIHWSKSLGGVHIVPAEDMTSRLREEEKPTPGELANQKFREQVGG